MNLTERCVPTIHHSHSLGAIWIDGFMGGLQAKFVIYILDQDIEFVGEAHA